MDISILNSNYKRQRLIENWSSLVWSERYSTNGDFEMVSPNISEIVSLLPLGGPEDPPTLVAVDDSDVPMVVESHKIEKPKNGPPQITTTGRSFETVFDRRVTIFSVASDMPRTETKIASTSVSGLVHNVASDIVVTGTPNAKDKIPEINLLNSITGDAGDEVQYVIEPKELYEWMTETLALENYGLRAELGPSNTQIAVIIYNGVDRSKEVVFDVALDQIDDASYILSKLGSKNVMITATKNGMEYSNTGTDPSGLSRRVAFQDLSSEISYPVGADLTSLTINRGKVALADLLPVALFSGGIAEDLSAGYGSTYSLGDIVTLQGEYGLAQQARIAEFVRTQDNTGYKAYPTFESIVT